MSAAADTASSRHVLAPVFPGLGRGRHLGRREEVIAVPQKAWNRKRERQYEHIKEGLLDRGESTDTAEEIAARTVNKERARSGEAKEASRSSVRDI